VAGVTATLPEELLLFAYDDVTGRPLRGSTEVGCALAGAILVELAMAGRVTVVDGKLSVLDLAPTGDPIFDEVLARIASVETPLKPERWVAKLRSGLRDKVLARLIGRGALRFEEVPVLRVFSVRRYPVRDGSIKAAARARLDRVLLHNGEPDARTAALATLLNACGLTRRAFPDLGRKQLKVRMGELGDGHWASVAVRKAIRSIQAAA
jgi:hypothetical protein